MHRLLSRRSTAACIAVLAVGTAAALTITPASHDFGDVGVMGLANKEFEIVVPASSPAGTVLTLSVTGPDAGSFLPVDSIEVDAGGYPCPGGPPRSWTCHANVDFRPRSMGPKQATLVVTDNHGNRATALLKGNGVAALCRNVVVFCNYSHLYSGTFEWGTAIVGPASSTYDSAWVTLNPDGVVNCVGKEIDVEAGQTRMGRVSGPGLFGVEFLADPIYTWVYRITVACPTPYWPATADAAETPSQPAELGHHDYSSDNQPAGGPTLSLEAAIARLTQIKGTITYPSPENDPVNDVRGHVTVTWNLVRLP